MRPAETPSEPAPGVRGAAESKPNSAERVHEVVCLPRTLRDYRPAHLFSKANAQLTLASLVLDVGVAGQTQALKLWDLQHIGPVPPHPGGAGSFHALFGVR